MYWLQRPPYLKRLAAVALLAGAVVWDLRAAATEPYPVAAVPLAAGTQLSNDDVRWISLPQDRLPLPDLEGATLAAAVGEGEPITSAVLTKGIAAPEGWWTVPVRTGELALPGDEVLLVIADPPLTAIGVVVTAQTSSRHSLDYRPAEVAVPPDIAALVAAAEQEGRLITAARPGDGHR